MGSSNVVYVINKIVHVEKEIHIDNINFALVEYIIQTDENDNNDAKLIPTIMVRYLKDTVIKHYKNTKCGTKEILNEVKMLNYINHNISCPDLKVPKSYVYKLYKKKHHKHYIERIRGKDLLNWFSNGLNFVDFDDFALDIVFKIAKSIQVLHNNLIAHKDIKPENIILNFENGNLQITLIDFAYSKLIDDNKFYKNEEYCGTPVYLSPELFCGFTYHLLANDIWCFGAMIYSMYSGYHLPLCTYDKFNLHFDICRATINTCQMPKVIKKILHKIFVRQDKRIKINKIVKLLS